MTDETATRTSKIVSSPWLREVRSDLIKLAAAFVRGEVAPDWSEHKWCSTTPVTERRQVMRMLRDMDERIREYGVQLKNIADKLPGSIRADETSGIQAEIDAANRGLRKYIHEQLGFLTTDDNRPAEALIRLAVKRLRPEETSERRDPNEAHDLITPDIGYTPEKASGCEHDRQRLIDLGHQHCPNCHEALKASALQCKGGTCPEPHWCGVEQECLWHRWNKPKDAQPHPLDIVPEGHCVECRRPLPAPPCIYRDGCNKPEMCAAQGHCGGPIGNEAT